MKKLFAIIAVAMSLAACQPNIPQVPQVLGDATQQQQAAPAQSSGISPLGAGIAGAAVGYLAGKAGSNSGSHTVIERPVPSYSGSGYGNSYNRPRATVTTTTVKRGLFGGKTVTRTVRRSR